MMRVITRVKTGVSTNRMRYTVYANGVVLSKGGGVIRVAATRLGAARRLEIEVAAAAGCNRLYGRPTVPRTP